MSRPRTRPRDTTGHAEGCTRPFVQWRDVLGNNVGLCEACGSIFTRRGWTEPER